MKSIKIEGSLNGWVNISQMNPMILHINLWEKSLNKTIDCWLDQDAVAFLMASKLHAPMSSIILWGQYTGKYQFKAHAYSIKRLNPFQFTGEHVVPLTAHETTHLIQNKD